MSQYVEVDGPFNRFADDPSAYPDCTREPLFDEGDVAAWLLIGLAGTS